MCGCSMIKNFWWCEGRIAQLNFNGVALIGSNPRTICAPGKALFVILIYYGLQLFKREGKAVRVAGAQQLLD